MSTMWTALAAGLSTGDRKALARSISLVENEAAGYDVFMRSLPVLETRITGITGPPGAGKSTLTDALIGVFTEAGKKVAVLCVDPSSPFNLGALLGDRIRMSSWYNNPQVFIRSLATRGSMGGLTAKMLEITDVVRAAGFDEIIVETVGVGQSEVEIAGLADVTVVVLVPESGDEIQTMKAGLMEIADVFVVNKADRPGADMFIKNLRLMLAPSFQAERPEVPIIKTVASRQDGIAELASFIQTPKDDGVNSLKAWLRAERAYQLIQASRMKEIDKRSLVKEITALGNDFNIYRFIQQYQA